MNNGKDNILEQIIESVAEQLANSNYVAPAIREAHLNDPQILHVILMSAIDRIKEHSDQLTKLLVSEIEVSNFQKMAAERIYAKLVT